jgi:hypothetical protein
MPNKHFFYPIFDRYLYLSVFLSALVGFVLGVFVRPMAMAACLAACCGFGICANLPQYLRERRQRKNERQ